MADDDEKPRSRIVDAHGRRPEKSIERCPRCHVECPKGDTVRRVRSGGFGQVHDCCVACGYEFEESTV